MSAVVDRSLPSFRSMREDDLDEVMEIELLGYPQPWTRGIFRDCLRVGYLCQVLEIEGTIHAYGVMSSGGGEAHVLNLCVAEGERRRGVGSRLLQRMTEHAASVGAREIYLEVRPSNGDAIRLYRSRGFTQIGIRRGYYQAVGGREDAVVLRRQLAGEA